MVRGSSDFLPGSLASASVFPAWLELLEPQVDREKEQRAQI